MSLEDAFPRLTPHNHRITSPASPDYNCIAWSVGDAEHWCSQVSIGRQRLLPVTAESVFSKRLSNHSASRSVSTQG